SPWTQHAPWHRPRWQANGASRTSSEMRMFSTANMVPRDYGPRRGPVNRIGCGPSFIKAERSGLDGSGDAALSATRRMFLLPPPSRAPMEHRNLVSAQPQRTEEDFEKKLRPQSLDEFVGQQKIKDNLRVFLTAALQRGESLDHVMLSGPPGLGKTTLAYIIAEEMGAAVKTTSGPAPRPE